MKKLLVLGLVASLSLGGCATITRTEHDAWTVNTTPGGAAVKTSNGFSCDSTPCTFRMERKAEFDVTISKMGYKTWHGHVIHKVSGAGGAGMAGNVLVGGLIGVVVDSNSGAMFDLVPNPLVVALEKDDGTAVTGDGTHPVAVDGVTYTPAASSTSSSAAASSSAASSSAASSSASSAPAKQ